MQLAVRQEQRDRRGDGELHQFDVAGDRPAREPAAGHRHRGRHRDGDQQRAADQRERRRQRVEQPAHGDYLRGAAAGAAGGTAALECRTISARASASSASPSMPRLPMSRTQSASTGCAAFCHCASSAAGTT